MMNIKLIASIITLALIGAGVFYIQYLRKENQALEFERDNLKATLTKRNQLIDDYRKIETDNNTFKEKQYEKMQNLKDSHIDPNILGESFFMGLIQ